MAVDRNSLHNEAALNTLAVEQTWNFQGDLSHVTEARGNAAAFLRSLARTQPPTSPEVYDDVLMVVTELASNAFAYAPGPFSLRLRAVADTVQIAVADTNPAAPKPRPADLCGRGGLGWHLINSVAEQTITVPEDAGKTVHAFITW
ncbi:ATP-binding protein [Streptomyces sp. NPDC058657]|uniref:ATP-binding protein n=1 Tax=unclassified Streptomyces TaxID=2593676 RepID=UPI003646D630